MDNCNPRTLHAVHTRVLAGGLRRLTHNNMNFSSEALSLGRPSGAPAGALSGWAAAAATPRAKSSSGAPQDWQPAAATTAAEDLVGSLRGSNNSASLSKPLAPRGPSSSGAKRSDGAATRAADAPAGPASSTSGAFSLRAVRSRSNSLRDAIATTPSPPPADDAAALLVLTPASPAVAPSLHGIPPRAPVVPRDHHLQTAPTVLDALPASTVPLHELLQQPTTRDVQQPLATQAPAGPAAAAGSDRLRMALSVPATDSSSAPPPAAGHAAAASTTNNLPPHVEEAIHDHDAQILATLQPIRIRSAILTRGPPGPGPVGGSHGAPPAFPSAPALGGLTHLPAAAASHEALLAQQLAEAEQACMARRVSSLRSASQMLQPDGRLLRELQALAELDDGDGGEEDEQEEEGGRGHTGGEGADEAPSAQAQLAGAGPISAASSRARAPLLVGTSSSVAEDPQQAVSLAAQRLRHLGLSRSGQQGRLARLVQHMSIKLLPLQTAEDGGAGAGDENDAQGGEGGVRIPSTISAVTPSTVTPSASVLGPLASQPSATALAQPRKSLGCKRQAPEQQRGPPGGQDEGRDAPGDHDEQRKRHNAAAGDVPFAGATAYALLAVSMESNDGKQAAASPTPRASSFVNGATAALVQRQAVAENECATPRVRSALHPSPFTMFSEPDPPSTATAAAGRRQRGAGSAAAGFSTASGTNASSVVEASDLLWDPLRAASTPSLLELHAGAVLGVCDLEEPLTPTAAAAAVAAAGTARLLEVFERKVAMQQQQAAQQHEGAGVQPHHARG